MGWIEHDDCGANGLCVGGVWESNEHQYIIVRVGGGGVDALVLTAKRFLVENMSIEEFTDVCHFIQTVDIHEAVNKELARLS